MQVEAFKMFKESIKKMVDKFDYEDTDYIFLECSKIYNKRYAPFAENRKPNDLETKHNESNT